MLHLILAALSAYNQLGNQADAQSWTLQPSALATESANALSGHSARSPGEPHLLSTPLERGELIQAVLARNPGITAARRAWEAALARVPQATSLEDPTVSYSFAPQSVVGADSPFGHVVRLGQKIPYPGKRRLRADIARAEADGTHERVAEANLRLATLASNLYDELWHADRALAVTREHIDLLALYQQIATTRYAAGIAPQQAPIQAEVEGAHLLHRQTVLRTARRVATARINALLHRESGASVPSPPLVLDIGKPPRAEANMHGLLAPKPAELPSPELTSTTLTSTAVTSMALANRPEIAQRQAAIEARRAAVDLEKLRLRPDFEPTAAYNSMWRNPDHRWQIGVSLRVPLWRKGIRARIAEAQAKLGESESALEAAEDTVQAEVEIALAELEQAHHVLRLYRNRVLPASRDQIAAARAAFESGTASMLALIDAERSLLMAELSYLDAVAAASRARAQLDHATGRLPHANADAARSAPHGPKVPRPGVTEERTHP